MLSAAIVVHNLVHPIAATGLAGTVAFYLFYAAIFVAGTLALTFDRRLRATAAASGAAVLIAGAWAGLGTARAGRLLSSWPPSPNTPP